MEVVIIRGAVPIATASDVIGCLMGDLMVNDRDYSQAICFPMQRQHYKYACTAGKGSQGRFICG